MPPSESALAKAAGPKGSSSRSDALSVFGVRSSHQNSDVNASKFPHDNGNLGQSPRINSRISNSSGIDFERLSSQQAFKRTLPPWSHASDSKGHMKGINGINDDEVVMFESKSSRVLQPSMMHGKSTSTPQYASSTDSIYRPVVGDERLNRNDERLIYQAALEVYWLSTFTCDTMLKIGSMCHSESSTSL